MADTHETIADIIAEIRALSNTISDGIIAINGRSIADRLEAAHKSECGNSAKLREAAEYAVAEVSHFIGRVGDYDDWLAGVVAKCRAALDAPPRNCDRYATVDEARKAHEAICEKYGKCHNGCPLNNEEHYSAFDCFEAWLFATATEKEGGEKC